MADKADIPDDLPEKVKEAIQNKDKMTEEEFEKAIAASLYCFTAHNKPGCTKKCMRGLGHGGKHYCANHGYFS